MLLQTSKSYILLWVMVFTNISLKAQDTPQSFSLKECMTYALQNHSNIKKAQLDLGKSEQSIKEIFSYGLPQVSMNGQFAYNLKLPTNYVPAQFFGGKAGDLAPLKFGTDINVNAGVEASQLLYSQTFTLGLKASRRLAELSELVIDKTKQDVVYNVAKLYYAIQLTAWQKNILVSNLKQINGLIAVTEKQFQGGFAKKIDVDRLKVTKINLETQLQNLDLQLETQHQYLKFSMQMPLEQPIALADSITENTYKVPELAAIQPNFVNKMELKILNKQNEVTEGYMKGFKAETYPSLYGFANYNLQGQGNDFARLGTNKGWADFSAIGLRFKVPIFDGFRTKTKIETSLLTMKQVEEDKKMALMAFNLQHNNAVRTLRSNMNSLAALKENRKIAEEVYRVSQNRYKEGIAPIIELLQAETAMRDAQTNYISALMQVKLSELDILQANGELIKLAN
jgi:outer membrane protein